MLFVQEKSGSYRKAPHKVILQEALQVSKKVLRSDTTITNQEIAVQAIGAQLCNLEEENIGCLFLNAPLKILGWEILFHGTVNSAHAYPRVIVKKAIEYNATAVIIAHNHPSGKTTPSRNDLLMTGTVMQALSVIDVKVLDHLIIGNEITSLQETGQIARLQEKMNQEDWRRLI